MKKIIVALTMVSLIAAGCGSSDDGNGNSGGGTTAATLSLPTNNSECITGTSINDSQSAVTFEWTAVPNTVTYFVNVTNLNTANAQPIQYSAGTNTTQTINLLKGTPYSWYVSSRKASGETGQSEKWKFYNAGDPVTSHAPFPADLVSPVMSSTILTTSITLQWRSSDIDNDIANHKVYMDTNTNPSTLVGTVTQQSLPNLTVNSGGTYYWKVVTTDGAGNATTSPVFQFKVQ
ncbi:hypothetical protein Q765_02020 [Flavobacterium rivuli WB 3.3-2 = DSM 21788]|uniref:Fibronectin type-III domain-containing protein n=1 Tax=Flavobacterium rivuli WB 3.3-2 = DSM 21788 TaxID=1121895 RepID=A0A0A2M7T3_9FLAO|nr:hypothetical protein [Flavobacterium rivuli]KGO88697.1 hypothetical protein Q765_02020 [Flavobacterium rivuli WB 3.3-2 = DSM 21788]